jgi:hypothetical protein
MTFTHHTGTLLNPRGKKLIEIKGVIVYHGQSLPINGNE